MAKRKHTTALFEVYQQTVSSDGPRKPGLAQRWAEWLRQRTNAANAKRSSRVQSESPPVAKLPERPAREAAASPGLRFDFDSDEQSIRIILSYSSAAVICFAVLVLIGLAYLTGRHSGRAPLPLLAQRTTEQIQKGKADRSVLDVGRNLSTAIASVGTPAQPSPKPRTSNDPHPSATFKSEARPRQIGLNYVIIQTYPAQKDAEAAKDLLCKHGIPCTVEPPPAGWWRSSQKVYSVIGTTGFDRVHCAEFEHYIDSIMKVSRQFAGKVRYNRFNPAPYLWRKVK